jgi:hypothetical protein
MSRAFVLLLGMVAVGAVVLTVLAQSQEGKTLTQSEMKRQFATLAEKSATLTAQHKLLAALTGDFDQAVEVRPGPGQSMKSHCLSTGTSLMGGLFVKIESRSAPDEELKGERLTIYGYDTVAGKFTVWSIDSGSTFAASAAGDYDPSTKTFTLEGERYGRGSDKVPYHWVVRLEDGRAFTQEIQMKPPTGGQYVSVVVVKNTLRK